MPAKTVLKKLTGDLGLESGLTLTHIQDRWGEYFSDPLVRHIYPSDIREGCLVINVDSPVWLQQLTYLKEETASKFRHLSINKVSFRIGKVWRKDVKNTEMPMDLSITAVDTPRWAEELLLQVEDAELRCQLRNIIVRSISLSTDGDNQ